MRPVTTAVFWIQSTDIKVEQLDAGVERLLKRLLFPPQHILDVLLLFPNLGKNIAHRSSKNIHELVEERRAESQGASVANRSAQNPAEHVVAVGVPRLDAICDRKAKRADMIGNNAESHIGGLLRVESRELRGIGQRAAVFPAAQFFNPVEYWPEDVGLVIRDFRDS